MKNMRSSKGTFGAASSTRGSPHTPASKGRSTPAITDTGGKIKVSASNGREAYICGAEPSSKPGKTYGA